MRISDVVGVNEVSQHDQHKAALKTTGFWGKAAAGCIILARSTGRLLIAHRSNDVQEPNTWGTWGGAIDRGENPAEAVKREVHEETGYQGAIAVEPLYVFRSGTFAYHNFLVIVDEEFSPTLDWENQGFRWCQYGKWPSPMHFGLKGLLANPESAATIKAALPSRKPEAT